MHELHLTVAAADDAAQYKRLAVGRVVEFQGTLCFAGAARVLVLAVFRDVVPALLPGVARVAKMRLSPAKPRCNRATVLALVLDKIAAMQLALLPNPTAPATHKLLCLERLVLVASIATALPAKVGLPTLEARVIGKAIHGEVHRAVVEAASRVRDAGVLVKPLECKPLLRFFLDLFLKLLKRPKLAHDGGVLHLLFAEGAVPEMERDLGARPLATDLFQNACMVEVVAAVQPDARCRPKVLHPADVAELSVILVDIFRPAVRMDAGWMVLLATNPGARVPTVPHFLTCTPALPQTFTVDANILQRGRLVEGVRCSVAFLQRCRTKSAPPGGFVVLELSAGVPEVVWYDKARGAKVLVTCPATYAVLIAVENGYHGERSSIWP
mmetsp:Transcript_43286/g.109338  ORF Transcript_43286/g.109338 Transcript_43286/m.109338 type:complete len:383 (+) Transcript_43286:4540-5688(+)